MFSLEQQIELWREQLQQTEAVSAAEADELECHLRDSIDALAGSRLSEEESFLVARHRVGSPEALALEFSKINGARTWMRRAQWMLAGYLVLSFILSISGAVGSSLTMFALQQKLPLWLTFVTSGVSATACVLLIALWARAVSNGGSLGMQSIASRFAELARSGKYAQLCILIAAIVVAKYAVQFGSSLWFIQILGVETFGVAAAVNSMSGWFSHLLILSAIVSVLVWLLIRDGKPANRPWSTSRVVFASVALTLVIFATYGVLSFGLSPIYGKSVAGVVAS